MRNLDLMAIAGTTILVPYLQVNPLQLIWRSGNQLLNLWEPDLQIDQL